MDLEYATSEHPATAHPNAIESEKALSDATLSQIPLKVSSLKATQAACRDDLTVLLDATYNCKSIDVLTQLTAELRKLHPWFLSGCPTDGGLRIHTDRLPKLQDKTMESMRNFE